MAIDQSRETVSSIQHILSIVVLCYCIRVFSSARGLSASPLDARPRDTAIDQSQTTKMESNDHI